jgi:hypothetical protein
MLVRVTGHAASLMTRVYRYLLVAAAAIAVVLLWRYVLTVIAVLAGLFIIAWTWRVVAQTAAVLRFRAAYPVKNLLLVYSNSPHWQRYVEETWLPRWGERAIVLNWSERHTWRRSPDVALFRAFLGGGGFAREYNPAAIVVPPTGRRVRIVRFWRAFRDFKHGKDRLLRQAEADLQSALDALPARPDTPHAPNADASSVQRR